MKQFNHHSQFKDKRSQISYTDKTTAHIGVLIDGKIREVYRIELVNAIPKKGKAYDEVHVSDMLDEGHFFQPTVEKRRTLRPRTTVEAFAKKYEKLARRQCLESK